MMSTIVRNWGNSLALRIPKLYAEKLHLQVGTEVELTADDGQLVVRPVTPPRLTLAELLEQVTPDNLHGEWQLGADVGNEVW